MKIVYEEIKKALTEKGYAWNEIRIGPYHGYTFLFSVYIDGELKEIYNSTTNEFLAQD